MEENDKVKLTFIIKSIFSIDTFWNKLIEDYKKKDDNFHFIGFLINIYLEITNNIPNIEFNPYFFENEEQFFQKINKIFNNEFKYIENNIYFNKELIELNNNDEDLYFEIKIDEIKKIKYKFHYLNFSDIENILEENDDLINNPKYFIIKNDEYEYIELSSDFEDEEIYVISNDIKDLYIYY